MTIFMSIIMIIFFKMMLIMIDMVLINRQISNFPPWIPTSFTEKTTKTICKFKVLPVPWLYKRMSLM